MLMIPSTAAARTLARPLLTGLALGVLSGVVALAGEKSLCKLKDFENVEVRYGGFTLGADATVHIIAIGDGLKSKKIENEWPMFSYGWILDAETRWPVWVMEYRETEKHEYGRSFDGTVSLPKGEYEVYFTAYAYGAATWFSSYYFNIDRRDTKDHGGEKGKGYTSWFEEFFGEEFDTEWSGKAKNWGIEVLVDNSVKSSTFSPPKKNALAVYQSVGLGESVRIREGFELKDSIPLVVYAFGELDGSGKVADYGWIMDKSTRKKVWEMTKRNTDHAGGAKKNVLSHKTIRLGPGVYTLHYYTDDSHSAPDWNSAPPYDPLNYGITLSVTDAAHKKSFSRVDVSERDDALVRLVKIHDNEFRSQTFTLKKETPLRVYAIGERSYSSRQMADDAWIIDARTREKVWSMDSEETEHAGGAEKNQMVDEIVNLPAGTYTLYYQSDDSHSYDDWNDDPPYDAEYYGVTLFPGGKNFDKASFKEGGDEMDAGIIAQIVRVGDGADRSKSFSISKQTKVRVYALGEGMNREMYDYGYIERSSGHDVVWEMTYGMTFHAGGSKKNRLVNTTLVLDPGTYVLRYRTDDSHSFGDWNDSAPDDPTMWGITIFKEN